MSDRPMRVLLFANNRVGWQVAERLRATDEVVGVVVHPPGRRRYGDEIVGALGLPPERTFDAARLPEPATRDAIAALGAEIGVSALFGFILRREVLDLLPGGCVNIHPAYLPYNRGAHPNVWSIVDGTPAGATLHWIDEGVDTGDVIARRAVAVEATDTGGTLYRKLEEACLTLFDEAWPQVRAGTAPRSPQRPGGTAHRVADLARLDEIDLDRTYTGRELVNLLRARTFPPYPGPFFRDDGRKVYLRLELERAGDIGQD